MKPKSVSYLPLVLVQHLVAGVHGRAGRLVAPDAVHNPKVGEADDEEREEVLHHHRVEAVELAQVDAVHHGEAGIAEGLHPRGRGGVANGAYSEHDGGGQA